MSIYEYTDADGDSLRIRVEGTDDEPVLFMTVDPRGVMIPLPRIDAYVAAIQALAQEAHQRASMAASVAQPTPGPTGPHTPAQDPATGKD